MWKLQSTQYSASLKSLLCSLCDLVSNNSVLLDMSSCVSAWGSVTYDCKS